MLVVKLQTVNHTSSLSTELIFLKKLIISGYEIRNYTSSVHNSIAEKAYLTMDVLITFLLVQVPTKLVIFFGC